MAKKVTVRFSMQEMEVADKFMRDVGVTDLERLLKLCFYWTMRKGYEGDASNPTDTPRDSDTAEVVSSSSPVLAEQGNLADP